MNPALRINSARKGIRSSLACCTAILLMMLAACGQTGPLYLPDETGTDPVTADQAAEDGQESGKEDGEENGAGR